MAWLYIIHFDQPYKHARHYLGWTGRDVAWRLEDHVAGRGSRLLAAVVNAGIAVRVTWTRRVKLTEARTLERRLKNSRQSCLLCPECRASSLESRRVGQRARRDKRRSASSGTP